MIQLYKGAERSPFLHEIDVPGWEQLGWSRDPQPTPSPVAESQPAIPNPLAPTREAREAELIGLYFGDSGDQANWRPIKRIADGHSIEKPDAGWDEAIPLILSAEFHE